MDLIAAALPVRGHTDRIIEKVLGGDSLRLCRKVGKAYRQQSALRDDTMPWPPRIILNAVVTAAIFASQASAARAEIMPDLPDVIVCSVKDPTGTFPWEQLVYYVSARMSDGTTLFKTLTSDPVVLLVSPDGMINGPNLADCDGRSVDSLRAEDRAFSLARPNRE